MTPTEPGRSNAPAPQRKLGERELVFHWANLPGRSGPKTAASILHYMKSIDAFRNSAGKPFPQMTVADIARYVDGGGSINSLSKVLKFLTWSYAYGYITVDLAYAYEHRNPHIVKTDKVWETQDEAVFEDWVATCKVKNPTTRELYRKSIMELWSYFDRPLSTLTHADVMVMNVSLNDRGIGVRFAQWLARRSIAVASPDVPDPVSPVDSVPEWLPKLEKNIRHLLNFQETIEKVMALWNHEFALLREEKPALEARLAALETGGARSSGAWPLLAARIHDLEAKASKPESTEAYRSLAKQITNMEDLWNRQLEERLANQDRLHATTTEGLSQCMKLIHDLVVTCYTGTNPIHPVDAKDRLHLVQTMIRFRNRTSELPGTADDADHSPSALMAGARNGVAHAPGDDDKWPG